MQITLGQQYSVEEKPIVIPYIYINRHAGTPEKHWCPCMTINVSIQYNGGLLPDIIFDDPMLSNTTMLDVVLNCLCFCFFSCVLLPNIVLLTQCCVLLPDIILLTQCYCHRGTWVNAMERFRSSVDPMLLPSGNLGKCHGEIS